MGKVVIFDWGGVVESHENNFHDMNMAKVRLIRRYNKNLSDQEILNKWVYRTSDGVSLGLTNKESDVVDWVNYLEGIMGIDVPFLEFKQAYLEEFSLIKYYSDVVSFAHSLKSKCKIAILSNLTPFDKKRIDDQYDLKMFDKVYLTFELGMRKPDKEIYDYVLDDLGVLPEEILFIDDDKDNIDGAKRCGWNTCQAFGYELDKIKECVEQFLNMID